MLTRTTREASVNNAHSFALLLIFYIGRFDDVEIWQDREQYDERWFGRLSLLVSVSSKSFQYALAVIRTYYRVENNGEVVPRSEKLNCLQLCFNGYNYDVVPVNSILRRVHIIPDFDFQDRYYVNENIILR